MKSVKIIKAISFTYAKKLTGMVALSSRVVRLPRAILWHTINIKPFPSMVSVTKNEDNNNVVTTTLKFLTPDDLQFRYCRPVFKVTLTDGRQFLIGSDQRPYPMIEITENCAESVNNNQLNEVIVTYKSLHIPPYIKV